jgi:hypothetical protein
VKIQVFTRRTTSSRLYQASLLLAATLFLVVFSPTLIFAQATDPLSVFNASSAATNADDVEGGAALFADDAVVTVAGVTYTGKAEIRKWRELGKTIQERVEVVGPSRVDGNKLTTVIRRTNPQTRAAGIDFLESNVEVTVVNGKITSFIGIPTPATLPKLQKLAALANPAPGLPASGAGGSATSTAVDSWPVFLLVVLAGALTFAIYLRKVRLAKTR